MDRGPETSPSGTTPIQPGNEAFHVSKVPVHAVHEALKLLDEPLKLGNEASNLFNEPFPTGLAGSTASLERTEALRQQHPQGIAHAGGTITGPDPARPLYRFLAGSRASGGSRVRSPRAPPCG